MRELLRLAWEHTVTRCAGRRLVAEALGDEPGCATHVLALGKVAGEMFAGARDVKGARLVASLAVTSDGVDAPGPHEVIVGDHPVPGSGSLRAAQRALAWAAEARAAGQRVLGLVSGGASALCEAPRAPLTPEDLFATHRALVASGAPIDEMNAVRRCLSAVKDGGLAAALGDSLVRVMVLVDVPSGRPEVVASGPLSPPSSDPVEAMRILTARGVQVPASVLSFLESPAAAVPLANPPAAEVLGTPASMAQTMASRLRARGTLETVVRPPTTAPIEVLVDEIVAHLCRGDGVWVTPGEASVTVPPGLIGADGGRARHLALAVRVAMAREAPDVRWLFLAGASDGRDGAGASGALVGDDTPLDGAAEAQAAFASGPFLTAPGAALPETPPRTNLTDLYVAVRL